MNATSTDVRMSVKILDTHPFLYLDTLIPYCIFVIFLYSHWVYELNLTIHYVAVLAEKTLYLNISYLLCNCTKKARKWCLNERMQSNYFTLVLATNPGHVFFFSILQAMLWDCSCKPTDLTPCHANGQSLVERTMCLGDCSQGSGQAVVLWEIRVEAFFM